MVLITEPDSFLRPRKHVTRFGQLYPRAWRQVDHLRADREGLGGWPDWCFLPLAGSFAIVTGGRALPPGERVEHVGILGALAAWRVTQGIYRFDPTVLDALWDTPVTGDIPTEVLHHLPEWCVYVATPGKTWNGATLHGFFAHLEHDSNDGRTELRLVLDVTGADGDDLIVIPVHLGQGGVAEGVAAMMRESARHQPIPSSVHGDVIEAVSGTVSPLVSLVLYLCSQAAEIRSGSGGGRPPTRAKAVKTKKGMRLFPPEQPRSWEVGYRLGAALRKGMCGQGVETEHPGSHASPRPHVRRAHWHSFWTGRRDRPEVRSVVVKWLPPIPVNVVDIEDLTPTVRQVASD